MSVCFAVYSFTYFALCMVLLKSIILLRNCDSYIHNHISYIESFGVLYIWSDRQNNIRFLCGFFKYLADKEISKCFKQFKIFSQKNFF